MRSIFVLFVLCCAVSLISGQGFLDDKSGEKSEKKSGKIARIPMSRSENVRESSPIRSKDDDDSDSPKRDDKDDKKIENSVEEVERTTKRRKPKTTTEKSNDYPSDDEEDSKSESKKKGRGKSTKSADSFNDNGQYAYNIARWIFGETTNEFGSQSN